MFLECKDINFKYEIKPILTKISLQFEKGYLYGIIGPNASGKTTLLKVLRGILKPDTGQVLINDINIKKLKIREIAKRIAVVSQTPTIDFNFTVKEIIEMGRYAHIDRFSRMTNEDKKIISNIIIKFNLKELQDRSFRELSGGEQQKIMISRALAQQSKIILLDEPTSHLDLNYKIEFMELLKKYINEGLIVIIVLHDLNIASQFCDKLILMNNGCIEASGSPKDVITRENIKSVYNTNCIVRKNVYSNSVYITPLRSEIHTLSEYSNNGDIKKIHVMAGGGSALNILTNLKKFTVSVGIVNVLDEDYILASELKYNILSEAPFSPISKDTTLELKKVLNDVDFIILTNLLFGKGNIENLRVLNEIDKTIIILEKDPITERDFTGGLATEIYNRIKIKKNVKVANNSIELFNLIKSFEGIDNLESK